MDKRCTRYGCDELSVSDDGLCEHHHNVNHADEIAARDDMKRSYAMSSYFAVVPELVLGVAYGGASESTFREALRDVKRACEIAAEVFFDEKAGS